MTDAPIQLVEYNPAWPAQFAQEQRLMPKAIEQWQNLALPSNEP
jgi:GrpB-like predicted nucleotidyltransferase (UPF0157 family)